MLAQAPTAFPSQPRVPRAGPDLQPAAALAPLRGRTDAQAVQPGWVDIRVRASLRLYPCGPLRLAPPKCIPCLAAQIKVQSVGEDVRGSIGFGPR